MEKLYDNDGVVITKEKITFKDKIVDFTNISSVYVSASHKSILTHIPVLIGTVVFAAIVFILGLNHGYFFGIVFEDLIIATFLSPLFIFGIVYNIKYPVHTLFLDLRKEAVREDVITSQDKNQVEMICDILKEEIGEV